MKRIAGLILVLTLLIASGAGAQLPKTINYQGVLTDGMGTVVPDGSYELDLRLYTVSTGGSPVWECTETVTVSKGIFNAVLGNSCLLTPDFSELYYLGISVEGEVELTPRTALTSSAYSLNSLAVHGTANRFPSDGEVGVGTTNPQAMLEVYYESTASNDAAIMINNSSDPMGQNLLSFAFSGSEQASLRKPNNGDFFLSSGNGIVLRTGGTNSMKLLSGGNAGIGVDNPLEMLDVDGGVRIANSTGANAGTMRWSGSDFEGYTGSEWVSFTGAGSGSLPSGSTGQTLRYFESGWVATSSLFNAGAYIGIGTTTPEEKLHVYGTGIEGIIVESDNATAYTTLTLKTEAGAYDHLKLVKYAHSASGTKSGVSRANLSVVETGSTDGGPLMLSVDTANPIYFATGGTERMRIDGDGPVNVSSELKVGSDTQDGYMGLYKNGSPDPVIELEQDGDDGGQLSVNDSNGNTVFNVNNDSNGDGAIFLLRRSATQNGLVVDGNYLGTENPQVSITGSSRSTVFNMDNSGNSSVELPLESICRSEILDEPGVASINGNNSVSIDASHTTILSRTITVPASGYVLAMAASQINIIHTNGSESYCNFGVSDEEYPLPLTQDVNVGIPHTAPTGTYCLAAAPHGLFEVGSAGTYTFYYLGFRITPSDNIESIDSQLTLVYIPTSYGTVTPTMAGGSEEPEVETAARRGLSSAEIASERAASVADNEARIRDELAQMQDRLDQLKRELERIVD